MKNANFFLHELEKHQGFLSNNIFYQLLDL